MVLPYSGTRRPRVPGCRRTLHTPPTKPGRIPYTSGRLTRCVAPSRLQCLSSTHHVPHKTLLPRASLLVDLPGHPCTCTPTESPVVVVHEDQPTRLSLRSPGGPSYAGSHITPEVCRRRRGSGVFVVPVKFERGTRDRPRLGSRFLRCPGDGGRTDDGSRWGVSGPSSTSDWRVGPPRRCRFF